MLEIREVLARIERLSADRLSICLTEAWVRPHMSENGPVFDQTDLARLQLILDLTEDMGVNDEAVPVILDLIDEVNTLRRRMRALDAALEVEDRDAYEAVILRLKNGFREP